MVMMKKARAPQSGFGDPAPLIALGIISSIGYFVYNSSHHSNSSESTSKTTQAQASTPKLKLASKPYEDPNTGLSIPYPEGWQAQSSQEEGVIISFAPSVGSSDNAAIKVLLDAANGRALGSYADSFKNGLTDQAKNYKLISDVPMKAKDGTSLRILTTSFDKDGFNLTSMDAIGVMGDKVIVFDAHSNTSNWNTYKDVFLQAALE
jgi:hypothetical protein